jgi:predicted molibdopterin-dependent oxidoreductase YjgC
VYDNEGRLLKIIDGNANEIRMEYYIGSFSYVSKTIFPPFEREYDAESLPIVQGETVRVISRCRSVKVKALITDEVPAGMVWTAVYFLDS